MTVAEPAGRTTSALDIDKLSAGYGQSEVLHELTLEVREGQVAVLLGANGAGKTTLMRAISGVIRSQGRRTLFGEDLGHNTAARVAGLGVACVPQGRGTFNELSVEDNLRIGALQLPRDERAGAIEPWLDRFPRLAERRKANAGFLSGGEQQLLAVARACIGKPRLLLCDEPSLGLSPAMTSAIFEVFAELNESLGLSMLIVEQNARLALSIAHYAYVLETGRIVWRGAPQDLNSEAQLVQAYLGKELAE